MLVALPPSRGLSGRTRGRPVDLVGLSLPALTPSRLQVLDLLAQVSARPDATALLGESSSMTEAVAANVGWRQAPATPVRDLFSGVLFDALAYRSLSPGAKRRATARVLVFSAAWGVLRLDDAVPAHRLSMAARLPGLGMALSAFWRPPLAAVLDRLLDDDGGPLLDCRSAEYAAAWRPARRLADRVVAVRVLGAGGRVISHQAKHTRGLLARHLLSRPGRDPGDVAALAAAAGEAFDVRLGSPGRDGARVLEVFAG